MILKKIKINKKYLIFLGIVFLGCFVMGDFVSALEYGEIEKSQGGITAMLGSALLKGVNSVLYGILKLTLILFSGAMWLLDVMISPKMFTAVFFSDVAKSGINTAWSFVRDFFNLFFILIIVLVGLSTILGVGKFKDKAVLLRVVVAAMLINFSKPLTLLVIDASQVFMNFFAKAISDMQFGAQIQQLINFKSIVIGSGWTLKDNFTFFVIIVTLIIMTLIMAIMIFYLAISLIIRMIAFWVLIVLSPLAMFGFAMEGTKFGEMKKDWVEKLMSWAFYGPILLFFLWLAIILVSAISKAAVGGMGGFASESAQDLAVGNGGLAGFAVALFGMIIPYITAIYLLFYGYEQSQKISTGMAKKILAHGEKKINDWGNKVGHQMTFPGKREAVAEGFRERFKGTSLTKEGRKDKQAIRNAKAKDSIGGDKGAALRKYERSKAQEKINEWKENPLSNAEMDAKFRQGDLAATLYKSQNNQITDGDSFDTAMTNLTGHVGLQDNLKRETKRENMGSIIESEIKKGGHDRTTVAGKAAIQAIYKKEMGKKNNKELFKNQNENLFFDGAGLNQDTLDYLYLRSQGISQDDRRKMAEGGVFKDAEVRERLSSDIKGQFILGLRE